MAIIENGFFIKRFACTFLLFSFMYAEACVADEIQFNTDILDVTDKSNLDLSVFAKAGYIMPGVYHMSVIVNKKRIIDSDINFVTPPDDVKTSIPCLTENIAEKFGLKNQYAKNIKWILNKSTGLTCLVIPLNDGWIIRPDLSTSTLNLSIPQAWLEYIAPNWEPSSRWEDGIFGILFDYNTNFTSTRSNSSANHTGMSGNGTTGFNFGPWRARADWQSQIDLQSTNNNSNRFNWTRYYLFRPIKSLKSRLSIGENFISSDIFDSFRFTGVTLRSDDNMLPPNLRGYAPEISGVAKTNAKVTIRQQGAVLYQTQVASGPFRIQDLNDAVNGKLDVEIEEQDGTTTKFVVQTSDIPYLTRPGTLRYKLSTGRPTDFHHHSQGPIFYMGEFSWGIANGWSLYGGSIANHDYNAFVLGAGRDLMSLGAVSIDATHSYAKLPHTKTLNGNSYRVSYSKRFDDYQSQVTFAGYRFSERDYLSMADFLDARQFQYRTAGTKEMYTISFNKQFIDIGASLFIDYTHRTYWNKSTDDRYNVSLSRYFDFSKIKNISISANAYRNKYNRVNDDGVYLSFSIPWGDRGSLSYNTSKNKDSSTNQVSYFSSLRDSDSYQITTGKVGNQSAVSGFYTYSGDSVKMNANASYQENGFTSTGISLQGGMTATLKGAALHRINSPGSTRIMLDTDDVSDIPVRGYGAIVHSNIFGKAVVTDVNNYYLNKLSVDVNKLSDEVEAVNTVEQISLTEGAIGYRHFDIIRGEKALIYIRLSDGTYPPFGATVVNSEKKTVGIINDDGSAYLSGIQPSATMFVRWNGLEQCKVSFPKSLSTERLQNILLPCTSLK